MGKQKESVAQVKKLINDASTKQDQATDKKLADAEAKMTLAWEAADEKRKTWVEAKTKSLEKELKALKDPQLPELSQLLKIVDDKILDQSQANAKAWAAADKGIQTDLDLYKQAQLTELQSYAMLSRRQRTTRQKQLPASRRTSTPSHATWAMTSRSRTS